MASAKGARTAAIWGVGQLQDGEKRVLGEYETGYNTAQDQLAQGGAAYDPYAQRYNAGADMYSNALGLGGAEGSSAARAAFDAGPGYQFQMDQGLQALNRRRAAGGMLNSGNADIDAMKFGQGLASQGWGSWLDRLSGLDQRGLQTAGQQAGLGAQQAGLTTDYYNRRGQTIDQNVGNIVGLGVGALKAGDQAKAQNQANMLGAATSGLSLLGSLAGGGGGLLGGFTKLLGGGGYGSSGTTAWNSLSGAW